VLTMFAAQSFDPRLTWDAYADAKIAGDHVNKERGRVAIEDACTQASVNATAVEQRTHG